MKYLLALLLIVSSYAHAAQIEVGVGESYFQRSVTSIWWQAGFPAKFNLQSPSLSVGITGYITQSVRYHIGYTYLGHVHSDAISTYSGNSAPSPSNPLARWVGNGDTQEVYFTAAPEYRNGTWTFSLELGAAIYKTAFDENIYHLSGGWPYIAVHNPNLRITPILGASIGYGKTSVVLTAQTVRAEGDQYPSIAAGPMSNLSVRYRF